jgi:hypothetical protein
LNKAGRSIILILFSCAPPDLGQTAPNSAIQKPIEASVCKILENPSTYNNKLAKVRGVVRVGAEYSVLEEQSCSEGVWLVLSSSGAPGMETTVQGKGSPGGKNAKGVRIPAIRIQLVQDSNYSELVHYLDVSAKGETCAEAPPPEFPPDCRTYKITATFTGRIDGVSKQTRAARLRRSAEATDDGNGFGHMGLFDAQLVVQSVENVVAVDTADATGKTR